MCALCMHVCLMYDASETVGYLGNVCVFACYYVSLAHNSSSLVNSNNFLLSRDSFSSRKCKKKYEKPGAAGNDFLKMKYEKRNSCNTFTKLNCSLTFHYEIAEFQVN